MLMLLMALANFYTGPLAGRQIAPRTFAAVFFTFEPLPGHEAPLRSVGLKLRDSGGIWVEAPGLDGLGYALLGGPEGEVMVGRYNAALHDRIEAIVKARRFPPGEDDTSLRAAYWMGGTTPLAADALEWALTALEHMGCARTNLSTGWEPGMDEPGEDTRTWPGLLRQLRNGAPAYDPALVKRLLTRWPAP